MQLETECSCRGNNFDKMLQPSILMVLYRRDLHGFALISELADTPMFKGNQPDKAGVYRYLKKMEEAGLLTSDWSAPDDSARPKKIYSITDKGRYCLLTWGHAMSDYAKSMKHLADEISITING